jgi:hypothetical protein
MAFFTYHSLRATAAARLYAAGVDEQLKAEKTGHRSTDIRNYKRTSEEQLQTVIDLIQKPTTMSPPESKKVKPNECVSFRSGKEINITSGDITVNLRR